MHRLAFSRDGTTLASVSDDRTAIVWDVATGGALETLRGHAGMVHGVVFSPDGSTLYTSSLDDSVIAWDLAGTRGLARRLTRQAGHVTGWPSARATPTCRDINNMVFSPDGRTLASGMDDGTVVLTRMPDRTVLHKLTVSDGPGISALGFSPDGKILATGASNGEVRLWDPAGMARGRTWVAQAGPVISTTFSPDGMILATSGGEGTATLWDAGSGKQIGAPLPGVSQKWAMAAFPPTGHTLATAFQDGNVLL